MSFNFDIKNYFRPILFQLRYIFYKQIKYRNYIPCIKTLEETLQDIIENNLSISRFGDGELSIMCGGSIGFCRKDKKLEQRLKDIPINPIEKHMICLPPMLQSMAGLTKRSRKYWRNLLATEYPIWINYFGGREHYGNAFISRFYMDYQNIASAESIIKLWKNLWRDRNILIVEGVNTRMGMGNNLFDNAKSISRILCPAQDAYKQYDCIIEAVKRHYDGQLIIIGLGPTATVLAYDLSKLGFQALDIGHIDIEYEWFLRKATKKVNILNKAVNEYKAGGLNVTANISDDYKDQIVEDITIVSNIE